MTDILLVEDQQELNTLMCTFLERAGYQVKGVNSGALSIDKEKRQVFLNQKEIFLTIKEYELSKGHLKNDLEESKNRFFGRFIWGLGMLRDTLSDSKAKELKLLKGDMEMPHLFDSFYRGSNVGDKPGNGNSGCGCMAVCAGVGRSIGCECNSLHDIEHVDVKTIRKGGLFSR